MYLAVRRQAGRAAREADRHDPERHPEGIRRARHVDLPGAAVDAADRRFDPVTRTTSRRASTRSASPARMCATPAATAVEEMAYTLANGLAYVDELLARGGDVEKFAKRLSFFFYVHMDFFDEIAKFRAGRRLWALLMRDRYGVQDPKAQHFRFGVVCGGSSLSRGAAVQQHRPRRGRDDGRGDRRRAVDLHVRVRRGVPDPDRVLGRDRGPHAADHRVRERHRALGRPARRQPSASSSTPTAWSRRSRRSWARSTPTAA